MKSLLVVVFCLVGCNGNKSNISARFQQISVSPANDRFDIRILRDKDTSQEVICTFAGDSCWLTGRLIDDHGLVIHPLAQQAYTGVCTDDGCDVVEAFDSPPSTEHVTIEDAKQYDAKIQGHSGKAEYIRTHPCRLEHVWPKATRLNPQTLKPETDPPISQYTCGGIDEPINVWGELK